VKRCALAALLLTSGCHRTPVQPGDVMYRSAETLFKKGELKAALSQAEDGFKRCGRSLEWCWEFRLLKAETLIGMGQAKAAMTLLDVPGDPPNPNLRVRRRMHQGQALYRLSDYPNAEKALREARSLAAACNSPHLVAEVELRQSPVLEKLGRAGEADAILRHALEASTKAGDLYLQANTMGNLGFLALHQFRYEEAIFWLQKTHDVSDQIGATTLAAQAVGNLGFCYYQLGDLEKALPDFVEAESRFARAGNRRAQQVWLGDGATIFLDSGDFARAIDGFTRALAIARELAERVRIAEWLNYLALASLQTGQLDAAEQFNNESFAINKELADAGQERYNRLRSAQIAARRRQFEVAAGLFQSLLNSADPTPALEAQGGLADLYVEMGDKAKAEAQFRLAISAIEGRQAGLSIDDDKLSYLSSLVRFYQRYVDFLVQRGAIERALELVESSRARILTERVRTRIAMPHGPHAAELQQLARSSHRILLSYWLAPKLSYVWVITPARIKLLTLPGEKEIRELVESYRTAIEDRRNPIESHLPAGEKLSAMLLRPISELMPLGSRVVIVPDGALHSLGFDTLPSPADPSKYWIDDVTVSVTPSLGLMLHSRAKTKATRLSLLAMGDPEPPGQEYPRLPNARKEVDTIAAQFPGANTAVYEGPALHPSAYRQAGPARFSLIHFAAHATANRASPLESALILSREGNVYALTAREIVRVPLDADLVTLSSCRSAGARAYSGEGLVGLTWAFLQAGARRVIAGLWDVDDESTSALMVRLYSELARGVPAEEALRDAKLSLLHAESPYNKPYYWGPFQLYSENAQP
jgi:CHAT domain-containing protein